MDNPVLANDNDNDNDKQFIFRHVCPYNISQLYKHDEYAYKSM